jgi:hypothetical protein
MDAITLYKSKEQIIRSVLDADEDTITKIVDILKKTVKKKYPAQMSIDDLKAEVMKSVEDAENDKGTPQDDFFKEMDKW